MMGAMTESGFTLKTLSRQDPDFRNYLDGRFSKTHRALPLESLNVNSESEMVTFRIVPIEKIETPGFFPMWLEVFKFRYFLLLAFPAFVILIKNILGDVAIDGLLSLLSLLASFFLLAAANLWNDYSDHMRGLDRIHPESQKKPIQKGWVTAAATRHWAWAYLVLGIILGIPALILEPWLLAIVAVPGAFALLMWLHPQKGQRFRRGAELLIFLLVGPLFAVGFQIASTSIFDFETLWIGVITGWVAVFLIHLRNFESVMVNSQAGFQSTVVALGFERSKNLLVWWWISLWVFFGIFQMIYTSMIWWPLGSLAMAVATILPWMKRVNGLRSPMGSELLGAVGYGRGLVNVFWAWWLLQVFWQALL